MRVALAKQNRIINIIEAESVEHASAVFPDFGVLDGESVGIDWTKDGDTWVPPVSEVIVEKIEDISDRQFFQKLAIDGEITEQEALDAVGPGIIPSAMEGLISLLPTNQQFAARMLIRGATRYERNHPVAGLIRNLYGWTPEEADTFWKEAALL